VLLPRISLLTSPYVQYRDDYRDKSTELGLNTSLVYFEQGWLRTASVKYTLSARHVIEYRAGSGGSVDIFTLLDPNTLDYCYSETAPSPRSVWIDAKFESNAPLLNVTQCRFVTIRFVPAGPQFAGPPTRIAATFATAPAEPLVLTAWVSDNPPTLNVGNALLIAPADPPASPCPRSIRRPAKHSRRRNAIRQA
jgi:hypothetical protein